MIERKIVRYTYGIYDFIQQKRVPREVKIEGAPPRVVEAVERTHLARIYAPWEFIEFLQAWMRDKDRLTIPEVYWSLRRLFDAVPESYKNLTVAPPGRPRASAIAWDDDGTCVIEAASLEVAQALAHAPQEAERALDDAYPRVVAEFEGGIICDRRDAGLIESQCPLRIDEGGAVYGSRHDIPLKDLILSARHGFERVRVLGGGECDLRRKNLMLEDIRVERKVLAPVEIWQDLEEAARKAELPFEEFMTLKLSEICPC